MRPENGEGREKRAIVTGASRGIGAALARGLAARGFEVLGTSRGASRGEERYSESGAFRMASLDLCDAASIESFAGSAPTPDVLVNNAGQSQIGAAEDVSAASLRALFEVDFFGTVELTRALLPGMRKRAAETGHPVWIFNVGSLAGRFPVPFQSAYVSAKSALAGYTACLRSEVAPWNVHVVLLEPADIRTSIEPERIEVAEGAYQEAVATMAAARDRAMQTAGSPDPVVDTVLRIIVSNSRPKPVYPVGGHAPFFCFLKRLLPDRLVETLVRRRYGL